MKHYIWRYIRIRICNDIVSDENANLFHFDIRNNRQHFKGTSIYGTFKCETSKECWQSVSFVVFPPKLELAANEHQLGVALVSNMIEVFRIAGLLVLLMASNEYQSSVTHHNERTGQTCCWFVQTIRTVEL